MTLTSFRGWLVIPMVLLGLVGTCSLAEAGQTRPDASLYAEGAGWTVIAERKARTCTIALPFGDRQVLLRSFRPGGAAKYSIMFWKKSWLPVKAYYDFKIRNESGVLYQGEARAFQGEGRHGSLTVGLFDAKLLKDILASRVLYVTSDGASEAPYNLGNVRVGFQRFLDCLNEVENRTSRPSPPPKTRRMN